MYTDYQSALVYECDHVDDEGRCLPTHAQAYFISRTKSLDMRLRAQLAKRFPDLCLNPNDIKEVAHEGKIQYILIIIISLKVSHQFYLLYSLLSWHRPLFQFSK